ncbi:MAG: cation diffusion facilitator family transporter [Candidatus Nomurabacteria bacterium]|jgi:cation diffusion facilitator family transporter|nr:cation diffusion facilitator family transporter [Candidatus Nomurabacteria bacterium]
MINRRKVGWRTGLIGLVINLLLFAGKIVVGFLSGSVAILADAFNSLADAAGAIITMVGFAVSGWRKGKKYPFGYGRIEYVAGMIISMIIMFTAIVIGQASIERFFNSVEIETNWIFVAIPAVSVVIKIGFAVYIRAVNKKVQSGVLTVFGRDSLFDALATTVAILPLLLVGVTDFPVDAVVGSALAVFILFSGLLSFYQNAKPILGVAIKQQLKAKITAEILKYNSFAKVKNMNLHDYGPEKIVGTIEVEISERHKKQAYADLLSVQRVLKRVFGLDATIFWRA